MLTPFPSACLSAWATAQSSTLGADHPCVKASAFTNSYCLQKTHFETRDTYRLKVKGWKKTFHANRDQKKAGVAIFISDKIDFKTKAVKRDKDGHYIMIKGSSKKKI